MTTTESAPTRFTERIREATWDAHEDAAGSGFMTRLISGELPVEAYRDLVVQHWFAYVDLEAAATAMADDPVAGRFVFDELTRLPALEADLEALIGPDWRDQVTPSPQTEAYCARLREVGSTWPGGFVAHHYTRYLGDLSGGQMIGPAIERTYGFEEHAGTGFYVFDRIDDLKAFKNDYRELLDTSGWDDDEQARIIDEMLAAYRHNGAVLEQLGSVYA